MYRIGFIGSGKMSAALMGAILRGRLTDAKNMICSDISPAQLDNVKKEYGVQIAADNAQVLAESNVVILGFKPQNFPQAVENLKNLVRPEQIILSILAGVRIEKIRNYLPGRVIRVMPNTACLVGQMAAGFAAAPDVTAEDLETVQKILNCAGLALQVQEEELDAVTGLSGSGPAFAAYLIQSFITAGVKAGLDKEVARKLTLQTFRGTACLLQQWNMSPEDLIQMVSSPRGTTVAGREILESSDVRQVIERTVVRAKERSLELGR
ncbi:MAG: Pyrroline-5-carboxylate reductase [Planctomycetes bacterium ADurb.Bin412]|nr:MAG: Pyrroline-5-carboxylate reductase [Planctomycetes bacterium ADurb.Bin412]